MSGEKQKVEIGKAEMPKAENSVKGTTNIQPPSRSYCAPSRPTPNHPLPAPNGSEHREESFITKEVVAERLCVTPQTVVRWARTGRLPAHRFGRRVRFKWSEVENAKAVPADESTNATTHPAPLPVGGGEGIKEQGRQP